ncbi:MAG: hypothetical protein Q9217_005107 [Psora testacea]
MQELTALCNYAKVFPLNFEQQNPSSYNISLYEQLNIHAARLFSGEDESVLDFLELSSRGEDFSPLSIKTENQLWTHLGLTTTPRSPDPRCRLFFRQRTCLSNSSQTVNIPELACSGSEIQVCYNLKSAELSGSAPNDWSIRACAVHHSLDVKNVRANWIIIKGNDIMKDRVEQATSGRGRGGMSSFETLDRAFAASLATHLVLCDWAAEKWRWYINHLEDQFQNASRRTLTAPVTLPSGPAAAKEEYRMPPRTDTQKSKGSIVARISRTHSILTERFSISSPKLESPVQRTYTDPESGLSQPLPPHITMKNAPGPAPQSPQPTSENSGEQDFSFAKLQNIQYIEEKAHEALLILKQNISIIRQLKQYYDTIIKSKYLPQEIVQKCQADLEQFELRVNGVLNDLQMQVLRMETLLCLLGNRKTLLHSILEYHNTEINKLSTNNMISMTEDMNDIARKTKIETVSMKVITVVTLFFLPGTFISTLMSTEIFNSDSTKHAGPDPYTHLSPLQLYLVASLPLTFVTLLIWAALHWLEKHKEKVKAQAHRLESLLMV